MVHESDRLPPPLKALRMNDRRNATAERPSGVKDPTAEAALGVLGQSLDVMSPIAARFDFTVCRFMRTGGIIEAKLVDQATKHDAHVAQSKFTCATCFPLRNRLVAQLAQLAQQLINFRANANLKSGWSEQMNSDEKSFGEDFWGEEFGHKSFSYFSPSVFFPHGLLFEERSAKSVFSFGSNRDWTKTTPFEGSGRATQTCSQQRDGQRGWSKSPLLRTLNLVSGRVVRQNRNLNSPGPFFRRMNPTNG